MRRITIVAASVAVAVATMTGCGTAPAASKPATVAVAPVAATTPPIPNCHGVTLLEDDTQPSGFRCETAAEVAQDKAAQAAADKASAKAAKAAASATYYSSDIHSVAAYKIVGKPSYTCDYGYGTFTMRIRNMSGQFVGAVIFDLTLMGKSGAILWHESGSLSNLPAGATKTLDIMGQGCPSYKSVDFEVSLAY